MHIYYINLAGCIDRNTFMINQLQKYNYKRIEACNQINYYRYIKINSHLYNKPSTNACMASHLLAIKTAYDNGLEEVLVLEDDINIDILNQTWEELQLIWYGYKEKLDILQIHSASEHTVKHLYMNILKYRQIKLIEKTNLNYTHFWGCTGYIIHRSGMEKIMQFYNQNEQIFDIRSYKGVNVSDIFIYTICNSKILNIPLINIYDPMKFYSNIQTKQHIINSQEEPYKFIENNKQHFINIIKYYPFIPRIIHIYSNYTINNKFIINIKKYCYKWKLNIWNEKKLYKFVEENYPAYILEDKEEFFKYIAVYHFGGFYFCQNIELNNNIEKYLIQPIVVLNKKWEAFGSRKKYLELKNKLDNL